MIGIYFPSIAMWALTVGLAAFHTVKFYRFAFGETSPVSTPISAALVALFAAVVYPLAFFSVGSFAMQPAHDALQWLEISGHPLSVGIRATTVATADGFVAAAFSYFVSFGLAAAIMGAMVCASRHVLRSRSA